MVGWKKSEPKVVRQTVSSSDYSFRRSRTITGSSASSIRSASENNATLRSPRLKEHDLRRHRRKLTSYLFLLVLLMGGLWYLVSSYVSPSSVTVAAVNVPTLTTDTRDAYKEIARSYLSKYPLERFSFLFQGEKFSNYARSRAPELSEAMLSKDHDQIVAQMAVKVRQPVIVWSLNETRYYVDNQGVAFLKNQLPEPTIAVIDKSGATSEAGMLTSTRLLRFIGRVVTLVNESGVGTIESVELPIGTTREVDFKLTGSPYLIKAHLDRDPAGQASDIVSAVGYVQMKGISPQYIDVRVSSKAFYR